MATSSNDDELLSVSLRAALQWFDQQWRTGTTRSLQSVVRYAEKKHKELREGDIRRRFVFDLIRIDLEYRWCRWAGTEGGTPAPLLEAYAGVFPELITPTKPPIELLEAEFQARMMGGDTPCVADIRSRFPKADSALEMRLAKVESETLAMGAELPQLGDSTRLLDLVGIGGFGEVYKARQIEPNRIVAVKLLRSSSEEEDEALRRYLREASSIAKIDHPNVVRLFSTGLTTRKRRFLVLEFAGGGTLEQWFSKRRNKLKDSSPETYRKWQQVAAKLMLRIAEGVAAAHECGIVHRDLKPGNILFDDRGRPKVADFGFARDVADQFTTEGAGVGTRGYWSPEQLRREKTLDVRSDVFSLGVIFFELLTGKLPFVGPRMDSDILDEAVCAPSPSTLLPEIDLDLDTLCVACLEKPQEKRIQSGRELAEELRRYLSGEPIHRRPLSRTERLERFCRRHRLFLRVAALFALVGLLGGGVLYSNILDKARLQSEISETGDKLDQQKEKTALEAAAAEQAKAHAVQSAANAKTSDELKRLHQYASDMRSVETAWKQGDIAGAREILHRYEHRGEKALPSLRGIEWDYWQHAIAGEGVVIETGLNTVRDIALDTDKKLLAASDFVSVSLWDVTSRSKVSEWKINGKRQSQQWSTDKSSPADDSVDFSPNGKYLAATSMVLGPRKRVGSLRVWDTATQRRVINVTDSPSLSGRAVSFSPDGQTVIAGGYQNAWRAWQLDSGAELSRGTEISEPSRGFRLPSGVRSGANKSTYAAEGRLTAHDWEIVRSIRFSRDRHSLLTSCFHRAPIAWRWPQGGPEGNAPAAATDYGITVSTAESDTFLGLKNGVVNLHIELRNLPFGATADARQMSLKWDPRAECLDYRNGILAVGDENRAVSVWVVGQREMGTRPLQVYRGHEHGVSCVTVSKSGHIVSGDKGGTVRLWPQEDHSHFRVDNTVSAVRVKETGRANLTIFGTDGLLSGSIPTIEGESLGWRGISPDERFVAISLSQKQLRNRHRLIVWDMESQRTVFSHEYGPKRLTGDKLAFSDDGNRFAALVDLEQTVVWSLEDGSQVSTVSQAGVKRLVLDRTGQRIGLGTTGNISIWDVPSARKTCDIPVEAETNWGVPSFTFSIDGSRLWVDGLPTSLWATSTGRPVEEVPSPDRLLQEPSLGTPLRLYRLTGNLLEVYCGRTQQRLLSIRVKQEDFFGSSLFAFHAVPGGNGLSKSKTLDRVLDGWATAHR